MRKSTSKLSPRLDAVRSLRRAYEALIAFEWGLFNRIFGEEILSIPYSTKPATTSATGWANLRRTVDTVCAFQAIEEEFVWVMYGDDGATLLRPRPMVSNWRETIEMAKNLSKDVVQQLFLDPYPFTAQSSRFRPFQVDGVDDTIDALLSSL